ncbi:hypothetical protein TL16_g00266 [Triparma laevis f. inornata]|uniref:Uncharacterized protein n=1 Tax=Triparma laevis f. inornata TaxID=1714386 RepID=A0A9W7DLT0_9STRA|nr:hypothetical protein TL16_g00266 [Triparma laevis f. inornata]
MPTLISNELTLQSSCDSYSLVVETTLKSKSPSEPKLLCDDVTIKYNNKRVKLNAKILNLLPTLLGSNISLSLFASLKPNSNSNSKQYIQLLTGIDSTISSSPTFNLLNLKPHDLSVLNFKGDLMYLPVFKNVPGSVELEECVAEGVECVAVFRVEVWEGIESEEDFLGSDEGEVYEVEDIFGVVGGGKAKGFTQGDVEWIKKIAGGGVIETE